MLVLKCFIKLYLQIGYLEFSIKKYIRCKILVSPLKIKILYYTIVLKIISQKLKNIDQNKSYIICHFFLLHPIYLLLSCGFFCFVSYLLSRIGLGGAIKNHGSLGGAYCQV